MSESTFAGYSGRIDGRTLDERRESDEDLVSIARELIEKADTSPVRIFIDHTRADAYTGAMWGTGSTLFLKGTYDAVDVALLLYRAVHWVFRHENVQTKYPITLDIWSIGGTS